MSNGLMRPPRSAVMASNGILREGMKQLEAALNKFGDHTKDCDAEKRELDKCPCGWAALRVVLRQRGAAAQA